VDRDLYQPWAADSSLNIAVYIKYEDFLREVEESLSILEDERE